ncbi:hypothetical protein YDYSY3_38310 [Paenibacillus chitinolyticus]|uniref:hypothetical protein n=1 Tax=Paenibacillus chitinolyticus TaxID=79263 RepID=UPI0026E4DB47|nr:hypothetical protein [Paenibacillus chitinolyticus]GKS12831.1 hypothetical protein YDYSY3_38310 [Paenibacillus chitinolyticus]
MTFTEMIEAARAQGYVAVMSGPKIISLNRYAEKYKDECDYTFDDNGVITYFEHGMQWFSDVRLVRKMFA